MHLFNASMNLPIMLYFTLCDKVSNREKAVKVRVWKAFQVRQEAHMRQADIINF